MPTLKSFFALCLLTLVAATAGAADLKVATLDMQTVFDDYYRTLQYELQLRTSADMEYLRKLEAEGDALQKQMQEVVSRERSFTMSDEAKAENRERGKQLLQKIQEKERDLRNMQRKIDREKMQERKAITDVLLEKIGSYSKDQGYDLVFDVSGATTNGIPPILYSQESFDITPAVIAEINKGQADTIEKLKADIDAADAKLRAEAGGNDE